MIFAGLWTIPAFAVDKNDEGVAVLRPVESAGGGCLTWIRRGKVFSLDFRESGESCYIYQPDVGDPFVLSGSRHAVARMLDEELARHPDLRTSVLPCLDKILFKLLAVRTGILMDKHLLHNYEMTIEDADHMDVLRSEEKKTANKKAAGNAARKSFRPTMQIVTQRMDESFLKLGAEEWSLQFFVACQDGSVEKWTANGRLEQFSIDAVDHRVISPAGTLLMLPPPPAGS